MPRASVLNLLLSVCVCACLCVCVFLCFVCVWVSVHVCVCNVLGALVLDPTRSLLQRCFWWGCCVNLSLAALPSTQLRLLRRCGATARALQSQGTTDADGCLQGCVAHELLAGRACSIAGGPALSRPAGSAQCVLAVTGLNTSFLSCCCTAWQI
jgi:hypothetical protein